MHCTACIAQRIHLCLPSLILGFEYQAHHLFYFHKFLDPIFCARLVKKQKLKMTARGRGWPNLFLNIGRAWLTFAIGSRAR